MRIMRVNSCPICGSSPKIEEYMNKNGVRRRGIMCPRLCSVIPRKNKTNTFSIVYRGDGDANQIYKVWNKYTDLYLKNKDIPWYERKWEMEIDDELNKRIEDNIY